MAYTPNNAAASSSAPKNDNWKAQGFLNLFLPSRDGKRVKLGAIPLKESNSREKDMLAWLNEDPARVATILAKLEIEYRPAGQAEGSGFDLG